MAATSPSRCLTPRVPDTDLRRPYAFFRAAEGSCERESASLRGPRRRARDRQRLLLARRKRLRPARRGRWTSPDVARRLADPRRDRVAGAGRDDPRLAALP